MNLLVVEWCCSGLGGDPASLPGSLVREGLAMLRAVMGSLRDAENFPVKALVHPHLADAFCDDTKISPANPTDASAEISWEQLARKFDILWPIAPETDRILVELVDHTRPIFAHVLAPEAALIDLATDKKKTFEHLKKRGLPTPETFFPGQIAQLPVCARWVLKRRDGAGSQDMRILKDPAEASALNPDEWILQPLVGGTPVSQAILGGPGGCWYCPPCLQKISDDGAFTYQGGETPIRADLAERTGELARRLVATLPAWRGWLGVDMILGEKAEDDRILEINPRLTTSFVGLNEAAGGSLALATVRHALGLEGDMPRFSPARIAFDASGNLTQT